MEVELATDKDIGDIVALLKMSLGEDLMPKSETFWRWKHVENPFGASPVLLCRENDKLIGVRAFMRWQWKTKTEVFSALRAVDTATHPNHQGKGIFKKLTLSLVKNCTDQGDHFVFNTPNGQSKPGYIKMGWVEAGSLPIRLKAIRPFGMLKAYLSKVDLSGSGTFQNRNNQIEYYLNHPGLDRLIESFHTIQTGIISNITSSYLRWRYLQVPVASYIAVGEGDESTLQGLIIGRLKSTKYGTEFRITQLLSMDVAITRKLIRKLADMAGVDYITAEGITGKNYLKGLNALNVSGPSVTIRALAMTDLHQLVGFKHWSPVLGDLELF